MSSVHQKTDQLVQRGNGGMVSDTAVSRRAAVARILAATFPALTGCLNEATTRRTSLEKYGVLVVATFEEHRATALEVFAPKGTQVDLTGYRTAGFLQQEVVTLHITPRSDSEPVVVHLKETEKADFFRCSLQIRDNELITSIGPFQLDLR